MSGSGRKDFDVKHILRLRWKLFSHPSPAGGPAGGGCLPPDSSFEHWGPSQSRLLKSQERGNGVFWKKSASSASSAAAPAAGPPHGTPLPAAGRP
ncbi:KLHL1 protein, partial [Zosterops hypoxanthus]|nr:KLHL1 protein [Zosterops hypoxanthus]